MEWVAIHDKVPAGKYVVRTESDVIIGGKRVYGSSNKIQATVSYTESGKQTWSCNNQKVTHYLQGDTLD